MDFELLSIVISVLAFIVSMVSLWKSTLSPFKLKLGYGSPKFSMYKITPDMSGGDKTWWIPSIDMGFTFHNIGKRCGEVTDIRMVGVLKSKDTKRKFSFYPKWIVDYAKFDQYRGERFQWVDKSVKQDWYPLIIAGDETKSLNIVFEWISRWDEKYIGRLNLFLGIFSEKRGWNELEKYYIDITEDMYDSKSSYELGNPKLDGVRGKVEEEWLALKGRTNHLARAV